MNYYEWKSLYIWMKGIGIDTLGQLKRFIDTYTDGTKRDLLNKANALFVYGFTYQDLFGEVHR